MLNFCINTSSTSLFTYNHYLYILFIYHILAGCHCREVSRDIICGSAESRLEGYSCGKICGKALKCGNHTCTKPCHTGDCAPCATAPEVILTCNCGKSKLSEISTEDGVLGIVRTSCLDKIPTCGNICGKKLDCGGKGKLFYLYFEFTDKHQI